MNKFDVCYKMSLLFLKLTTFILCLRSNLCNTDTKMSFIRQDVLIKGNGRKQNHMIKYKDNEEEEYWNIWAKQKYI